MDAVIDKVDIMEYLILHHQEDPKMYHKLIKPFTATDNGDFSNS